MRCVGQIINLIIQYTIKEVGKYVHHVKIIVRFIKQSPSILKKFKECIKLEKKCQSKSFLSLDVPIKRNSTYLILNSALEFQRAFERYKEVDPQFIAKLEREEEASQDGIPCDGDWEITRRLVVLLERIYELTLCIFRFFICHIKYIF